MNPTYKPSMFASVEPAAAANTDDSCQCGAGLLHPNLILGLIIWLLVLTLLVIMLIVLLTWRRKDEVQRESLRHLQRESPPWVAGMREDEWKGYSSETVSNHWSCYKRTVLLCVWVERGKGRLFPGSYFVFGISEPSRRLASDLSVCFVLKHIRSYFICW